MIVYEPIHLVTLVGLPSIKYLAMTATELAIYHETDPLINLDNTYAGQQIMNFTHQSLPDSAVLEENWVGYKSHPVQGKWWTSDEIINRGGCGMRFLKANVVPEEPDEPKEKTPSGTGEVEYRVGTEVITSLLLEANDEITPDKRYTGIPLHRDENEKWVYEGLSDLKDNKAYVDIWVEGKEKETTTIMMPNGESQYVWIKWTVPKKEGTKKVYFSIRGNSDAIFEDGTRDKVITANIVDLSKNEPKDPRPEDRNDKYRYRNYKNQEDRETVEWEEWTGTPRWVKDWEWEENIVEVTKEKLDENGDVIETYVVEEGHGWWVDFGEWKFKESESYNLTLESI